MAIATSGNMPVKQAEDKKKNSGFDGAELKASLELVYSGIFSQAKRVFMEYETRRQKTISEIVLAGGGGVTKGLATFAQTFFAAPVHIANPFAKTEAPAFMRPVLESIGPEFAVAVGIALRLLEEGR